MQLRVSNLLSDTVWRLCTQINLVLFTVGMSLIYELKTRILFVGMEEDTDASQSQYSWPPYRNVGKFDPFGDDPRLAIHHVKFCQLTRTLCVGGAGGQVITFSINSTYSDVRLEVCNFTLKYSVYLNEQMCTSCIV